MFIYCTHNSANVTVYTCTFWYLYTITNRQQKQEEHEQEEEVCSITHAYIVNTVAGPTCTCSILIYYACTVQYVYIYS